MQDFLSVLQVLWETLQHQELEHQVRTSQNFAISPELHQQQFAVDLSIPPQIRTALRHLDIDLKIYSHTYQTL